MLLFFFIFIVETNAYVPFFKVLFLLHPISTILFPLADSEVLHASKIPLILTNNLKNAQNSSNSIKVLFPETINLQ